MNKEIKVDITPLLIEAMATNYKITKDIVNIYEKHKYKAYKLAKESKHYNHKIFCDGDIEKEINCKRLLGIILLLIKTENDELYKEYINLFKKGWLKLFNYLNNKKGKDITIQEIVDKFYNQKMTEDEVAAITLLPVYLENHLEYNLLKEERYYKFMKIFHQRIISYETKNKDNKLTLFDYDIISDDLKNKAKKVKNRIYENHGPIKYTHDLYGNFLETEEYRGFVEGLNMVVETENLMWGSVVDKLKFTQKDIEEICAIYFIYNKNYNLEESSKFLIGGLMLKMLAKGYMELKKYHFKNNKETLYIDLEHLENEVKYYKNKYEILSKENEQLGSEIDRLRNEYRKELEKENLELKKEIDRLKKEISNLKQNEKELFALREAVFEKENIQEENIGITKEEINIPNVRAIIIGGRESWQRKLQEQLPETFKFISGINEGFDVRGLDNVDYVFFNTNYMNHGVYYKVINYIRNKDIKIDYINNTSIELVKMELYKKINIILK